MRRDYGLVLAGLLCGLSMHACSTETTGTKTGQTVGNASGTAASANAAGTTGKSAASPSPAVAPASGSAGGAAPAVGSASGTAATAQSGHDYFASTLLPIFSQNCASCHADPDVQVATRGPLTIFSYAAMRVELADGTSAQTSTLFKTVHGLLIHGGGDRCTAGVDATPCKEIAVWWGLEFPSTAPATGSAAATGAVTSVSDFGRVYGYALDPSDQAASSSVSLYADGPAGTGNALGTVVANGTLADGGYGGSHSFTFDLPASVLDGKTHSLYAYSVSGTQQTLLTPGGTPFLAYGFSTAGRAYFASTVKAKLSVCTSCHLVSYEQQFYLLLTPTPAAGGTATNNSLIDKPAQANGVTHGGGQRCASVAASPCAELQQWWKIETGG